MAQNVSAGPAPVQRAQHHGEKVSRTRSFEWLARAGLMARGVIYGIVAILAIQLAFGDGGKTTDQQGAMRTLAQQPAGKAMLIALAVGLFGYALFRLTRAAIGHGTETSDDAKERLGGLGSGLVYAALCVSAVKMLLGSGGGSGDPDKTTGGVLGWPGGPWIVGIAGVVMLVVAAEQAKKGVKKEFCEESRTERMSRKMRSFFTGIGVFGHLARAVVFALIGYFLIKAAVEFDPDKAVGLDGALAKLADGPAGPVVLGVVAIGLLGFAVYSAMDSRYRRV